MRRCEFDGCQLEAVGQAVAQWSVADYVAYAMCDEHMQEALIILDARRVDGELPLDVRATYWDPVEDPRSH